MPSCSQGLTKRRVVLDAQAAEGSSNNKYLEFANPTDSDISLDEYGFPNTSNAPDVPGEYEYWCVAPSPAARTHRGTPIHRPLS